MSSRGLQARRRFSALGILVLLVSMALSSCSRDEPQVRSAEPAEPVVADGPLLRIGDIDPDTPARRISRIQPLARYLAGELADLGFVDARVVIARDIEEMGAFLASGEVDLYLDSGYPSLAVQEIAGSKILLRRWAQGGPEYATLFVARAAGGVSSLEELRGRSLALQEDYSTSGFLLPAGTLLELGMPLARVGGPGETSEGVVSYFFTRDEENTVEMVTSGQVAAGAISNQELGLMDSTLVGSLAVIGETEPMPRQLVSVRGDLPPETAERIAAALLQLAGADSEPVMLGDDPDGWTWKFEEISSDDRRRLDRLEQLVQLVREM